MAEASQGAPEGAAGVGRLVTGMVTSAKARKTITVVVERHVRHPLYGKLLRRRTKLHAHDENGECRVGDVVVIRECRPISKTKSWRLHAIVARASAATLLALADRGRAEGVQ
jgi:small subunit ribosomal protein S17